MENNMENVPTQEGAKKRRGPYAFSSTMGNISGEVSRKMPKVSRWRLSKSEGNVEDELHEVEADGAGAENKTENAIEKGFVDESETWTHSVIVDKDVDIDLPNVTMVTDIDCQRQLSSSTTSNNADDVDDFDLLQQNSDSAEETEPYLFTTKTTRIGTQPDLHDESPDVKEPLSDWLLPTSSVVMDPDEDEDDEGDVPWLEAEEEFADIEWYDADDIMDEADVSSTGTDEPKSFVPPKESCDDSPIYHGAPITVAESMLLILTLCLRHSLTGSCLVDILTLISLHCQTPNLCKTSLHLFHSYFSDLSMPLSFHKFCSTCGFLLETTCDKCPMCAKEFGITSKNISHFIEIPMLTQLQALFKRKDFCDDINYRFERRKTKMNNIEDIYDGRLYKELSEPGQFLCNKNNISFMWNTDGIPVFKSSKFSIWPLYFVINELPPSKRYLKENMIICGLWYGETKPCMGTFLKPFHSSLENIYTGVNVVNCNNQEINVKGILLCGTCDMPAKCTVLNMTQFNGKHGCTKCTQPGNVIAVGRGHARVFPCSFSNLENEKRNHNQFKENAEQAFQTKQPVLGVKGPSWFLYHMPDIVNGTAIDWMHQVLLGITRRFLHLWFDSKYSGESFSISHLVNVADSKLKNIKPPNFISRLPRSIKDHCKYWKASECRSWLLYYSLPVLRGLLLDVYFQHYLLLVEAIYLLNGDSISLETILHCEKILQHFCMMHATLYSDSQMTSNIHQLLHLCDVVRNLGPLWVYSCFAFESINGELLTLFHGTQHIDIQIANNISMFLRAPLLASGLEKDTAVTQFYNKMKNKLRNRRKKGVLICSSVNVMGIFKEYKLNEEEKRAIHLKVGSLSTKIVKTFYRILKDGVIISSREYAPGINRNSRTVSFTHGNMEKLGQVSRYIKVSNFKDCLCKGICECSVFFALVNLFHHGNVKLSTDNISSATVKHLVPCRRYPTQLVAVPIEKVSNLCVCVDCDDSSDILFVVRRPNCVEGD